MVQVWTNVRLKIELSEKVSNLLKENNNDSYCQSSANFVEVAIIHLLEHIKKKGNKIRW